jgi:hypothetical protein
VVQVALEVDGVPASRLRRVAAPGSGCVLVRHFVDQAVTVLVQPRAVAGLDAPGVDGGVLVVAVLVHAEAIAVTILDLRTLAVDTAPMSLTVAAPVRCAGVDSPVAVVAVGAASADPDEAVAVFISDCAVAVAPIAVFVQAVAAPFGEAHAYGGVAVVAIQLTRG